MSVLIGEDHASAPRPGLAGGFADGPLGGVPGDRVELWRRVLFTLGALFIYRIGAALPIAGLDPLAVRDLFAERSSGVLGLIQMSAGGGFRGIPIFALGIMPYVSAFIVVRLASRIVPQLGRLAAGGTAERARLNQYARILTLVLAALQATGVAFAPELVAGFVIVPELIFEATTVVTLVAGALFLTWLAEQISARGLGNGALLILAFGVAGRLPYLLAMHIEMYRNGDLEGAWLLALAAAMLAFLALVVFVERAERRIPIYDPDYEIGQGGPPGGYRYLSLKINPAGVMPALAAGIFIAPLWQSIATVGGNETPAAGYFSGSVAYLVLYGALIVIFAAFFNSAILNQDGTTRQLKQSGRPLPEKESAEETARLFRALHIALAAIYVTAACVLPLLFFRWKHFLFVLSGSQIFLLWWVTVSILERVRASWQS